MARSAGKKLVATVAPGCRQIDLQLCRGRFLPTNVCRIDRRRTIWWGREGEREASSSSPFGTDRASAAAEAVVHAVGRPPSRGNVKSD
jgi:hypothetical protein